MGNPPKTFIKIFALLLICFTISGQKRIPWQNEIAFKAGLIGSSNSKTPFLLRANNYGTVPNQSQLLYLNTSLKKNYDSLYTIDRKLKKLDFAYSLEPHINLGKVNQVILVEGYVKARYGPFEIYGGRRREIQGLVDSTLSIGSYIWSGNALPLPKIEISIPNYIPILANGLIAIKGNFAHGWFGRGDSVQNVLLHQKSLYGRIGKSQWKVQAFGGLNHQVQWGGYPTKPFFDKISNQTITNFGSDFNTFFKMATGLSLPGTGVASNSLPGVAANEAGNRIGNHLGTIDVGLQIKLKSSHLFFYRQSIYEDGSLFYLNNINDGLTGLSLTQKKGIIRKLCIEYLNTTSQGGPGSSGNTISELRGLDNYFNNGIYQDSWTYRQKVIGNPLMFPSAELDFVGESNRNEIVNNRVRAYHLNVNYVIGKFQAASRLLYSHNLGTYNTVIDKTLICFSQKIEYQRNSFFYFSEMAYDTGTLYSSNLAINLGVRKSLLLGI